MPLKSTRVTSPSKLSTEATAGSIISARFLKSTSISSRGYERLSPPWRISSFGEMRTFLPLVTFTSALNKSRSVTESSEPLNEFVLLIEKANHHISLLPGHRTPNLSNHRFWTSKEIDSYRNKSRFFVTSRPEDWNLSGKC